MSALAPAPQEPTEIVDLADELDGLRRRADEQAAQLRKNHAAVTQLAESVAQLVALGRKRNRWINLNSFVAYLLFTILLGGGMVFLYRARVRELEGRHTPPPAAAAKATEAPPVVADDTAAASLYAVVRAGDDAALVAREPEIAKAPLTPTERALFTDLIAQAKKRLGKTSIEDGITAFKSGAWSDAATALERAVADDPDGARTAQLRYYLGVARWKLGDHAAAVEQLRRALAGKLDAASNDARYYHAAALDKLGEAEKARAEYDRFATAFPQHPFAVAARRRSAILWRPKGAPAPRPRARKAAPKPPADGSGGGAAPSPAPTEPAPAAPTPPGAQPTEL